MSEGKPGYSIAVVERALDLLEALAAAEQPLGASELARLAGATKSATYRILVTLEERGYVVKAPANARYRLGTRLAYLGRKSLQGFDLRQLARPILEDLNERFNETVNLGVLDGHEVVYLDMLESHHGLRMAAQVGGRDPAYSTSLGKAILAFLPTAERERHFPERFEQRTPRTITDRAALAAELERIHELGVAEDTGENEAGSCCFGAPIFDYSGSVVAAISISAPASRMAYARAHEVAGAVRLAAREICNLIGGEQAMDHDIEPTGDAIASGPEGSRSWGEPRQAEAGGGSS